MAAAGNVIHSGEGSVMKWSSVGRVVGWGLAAGLVLLTSGDGRAVAAFTIRGIDPLEILNLRVEPNVMLLVDSSVSMATPPDAAPSVPGNPATNLPVVGADDPMSRFYHAKLAMRNVVAQYNEDVNFGIAQFGTADDDKGFVDAIGHGPFVYVSTDADANGLLARFTAASPQTTVTGVQTDMSDVFNSLNNTENGFGTAYPAGCVPGTNCRFYLKSRVFRDRVRFTFDTATGTFLSGAAMAADECLAPAGLLGHDTLARNPGGPLDRRACFAISYGGQDAIYWFTSPTFGHEGATPGNACAALVGNQNRSDDGPVAPAGSTPAHAIPAATDDVADIPECTFDNSSQLARKLRLGMGIADGSGATTAGFPERLGADDVGVNVNLDAANYDRISGLRLSPQVFGTDVTPTATALTSIQQYMTDFVFTTRPDAVDENCDGDERCLQRNYIVYIADGSSNGCAGDDANAAELKAQEMFAQTKSDKIETIVVAYTGDYGVDDADDLARAGSGGVPDPAVSGRWTCNLADGAAPTCRDAIRAQNATELEQAVARAVNVARFAGSYADQQSITETVFELVRTAGFCSEVGKCPDPDDPDTRYDNTLPLVFQSTFDMPGFIGHVRAFRRSTGIDANGDGFDDIVPAWGSTTGDTTGITANDAGGKLTYAVRKGMLDACNPADATGDGDTNDTSDIQDGECPYTVLHGGILATNSLKGSSMNGAIKRRILTTVSNGVFQYSATLGVQPNSNATSSAQLPHVLWPNDGLSTTLDTALGIGVDKYPADLVGFAALRTDFDVCTGSPLTAGCTSATPSVRAAAARQEARQRILAYMAGAEVARGAGAVVKRNATGNMIFKPRAWVLAESTLAAPGVVTPPLQPAPTLHDKEYTLYRDGIRNASKVTQPAFLAEGYGLRNPDLDATGTNVLGVDSRADLKPMMSMVYHAANDGLHAFRAGPSCNNSNTQLCEENGGEEAWMFVPFDQLGKLQERIHVPSREAHVYMLAAPVRFSDLFVKSSSPITAGLETGLEGKWRTVMYFGRGIAGKSITALDITFSGTYRTKVLETPLPGIVFNRGNPDTLEGTLVGAGGTLVNTNADYNSYLTMGETWSVPAFGRPLPLDDPDSDVDIQTSSTRAGRCPSGESPCVPEFVLWMGSGYGEDTEGSNFYMMDAQTGDILRRHDVGERDASTAALRQNVIVASPAGFNGDQLKSGSGLGHPLNSRVDRVYVGDIHGRLWKFVANSTLPVIFTDLGAAQPIGAAVGLIALEGKPHVYVETGFDRRVTPEAATELPPAASTPPFLMVGLRDDDATSDPPDSAGAPDFGGLGTVLFGLAFPTEPLIGYRGTVQPTTVFTDNAGTFISRVFFAGNQFIEPTENDCIGRFESIVYALGGVSGAAAYELPDEGGKAFRLSDQRVMGLRTVGGQLVVDRGIDAASAPPPPAPPKKKPEVPPSAGDVFVQKLKYGSTVCN
jgi:hypothetical protein